MGVIVNLRTAKKERWAVFSVNIESVHLRKVFFVQINVQSIVANTYNGLVLHVIKN